MQILRPGGTYGTERNLYRLRPHNGVDIMKYLYLAFLIVLSGAAYAATGTSPPVNIPITISSSAPTEATAAGFTTLAANYDFSQPFYATQSNWLDCTNTNSSLIWHWGSPGITPVFPCNINQRIDPSTGQTVMDLQYLASYSSYGQSGNNNYVSMQTIIRSGAAAATFPNMYLEAVYRIDSVYSSGGNTSGPTGVWQWMQNHTIELDFGELYGSSNGFGLFGWHNWETNTGAGIWVSYDSGYNHYIPAGWRPTDYHKYSALLTSDGTTARWVCAYIDDVLQGCGNPGATSAQYTDREWLLAWVGSNNLGPLVDTNLYIQYIRVWSCANWASQMCNGSTLSNSGGANPLVYWH
jgi:hypothetical protein